MSAMLPGGYPITRQCIAPTPLERLAAYMSTPPAIERRPLRDWLWEARQYASEQGPQGPITDYADRRGV